MNITINVKKDTQITKLGLYSEISKHIPFDELIYVEKEDGIPEFFGTTVQKAKIDFSIQITLLR